MLRRLSYEDYQSATENTELKKAIETDAIEVLEKALEVGKVDQEEFLHDVAVSEAAYEILDLLDYSDVRETYTEKCSHFISHLSHTVAFYKTL